MRAESISRKNSGTQLDHKERLEGVSAFGRTHANIAQSLLPKISGSESVGTEGTTIDSRGLTSDVESHSKGNGTVITFLYRSNASIEMASRFSIEIHPSRSKEAVDITISHPQDALGFETAMDGITQLIDVKGLGDIVICSGS